MTILATAGCAVGGFDDTAVSSPLKNDGGLDDNSGLSPTGACPTPLSACAGECVDFSKSGKHCGECGRPCIDGTCVGGVCTKPDADAGGGDEAGPCPGGATMCGGLCIDTSGDANNCGACGAKCPSGWGCKAGKCDVSCTAPLTDCSGLCVDVTSHAMHCGGCGKPCPLGHACSGSSCVLDCTGKTKCGDVCVDTSKDKNHCGECGNKCGLLAFCALGVCLGL